MEGRFATFRAVIKELEPGHPLDWIMQHYLIWGMESYKR
jgi:hypothetical protein